MKTKKRPHALAIETLEDRWVPATIHYVNGLLSITNITSVAPAALTVVQNSPNGFTVQDGAGSSSSFAGVSNIVIDMGNAKHNLNFDVNGLTYTGNLTANSHNGSDSINVTNSSATAGGIQGNTILATGTGVDTVNLNFGDDTVGGSTHAFLFGGNITVVNSNYNVLAPAAGAPGTEAFPSLFNFGNTSATTTVGGSLNITGMSSIKVCPVTIGGTAQPDLIKGGLNIQDSMLSVGANVRIQESPGPVATATLLTINKGVNVNTGSGGDQINVESVVVNGNTNVNSGSNPVSPAASDQISFGQVSIEAQNTTVVFNGNVTASHQGGGTANVRFAGAPVSGIPATVVNGYVDVNLGGGNNSLQTDISPAPNTAPGFIVNGNVLVNGGDGNNFINFAPGISGNITINLGNGNNTFNLLYAPTGTINWHSGNGNNGVNLLSNLSGQTWNVNFLFGNGNDSVNLEQLGFFGITGNVITGTIIGGTGTNTFNQVFPNPPGPPFNPTPFIIASPFTSVNF